jgi:hypothetical protein
MHSALLPDIPVCFVGAANNATRHVANERGAIRVLLPQFSGACVSTSGAIRFLPRRVGRIARDLTDFRQSDQGWASYV